MNKLDSLRAAIVEALPELGRDPARLRLWIERGTAQCRNSGNFSFTFAYRVNVLVLELGADIALLSLALFRWLQVHQPDRLAPHSDGFTFDADVLDNATADVLVQIDLTQNVIVTAREDGRFDLAYQAEPFPLFDDDLGIAGISPVPALGEIVLAEDGVAVNRPA